MQKRDLPSASVNFSFVHVTFGQLFVLQQDILSTSFNSLCVRGTFHQLFVHPRALALTSVNFLCVRGTFQKVPFGCWTVCQLHSTFCVVTRSSINFSYNHETICQRTVLRTHGNVRSTFCQLSIRPRDIPSSFVSFSCDRVIILQYSVHQQNLPSTSDNFRSIHETCCQLSVHRFELPSSFRASAGHSVNFHDIFMCPRNLP